MSSRALQSHHVLAALALFGFTGLAIPGCLLATQIKLTLTTTARCPTDTDGTEAKMVDVVIEAARGGEISTSTTSTDCTDGDLGSLVFVPGSDADDAVSVVMAMHVDPTDDVPCVTFSSMSTNTCATSIRGPSDDTVNAYRLLPAECCDGDASTSCVFEGFACTDDSPPGCDPTVADAGVLVLDPCIVARRRITFIPHVKLELPVSLDASCIGITCDAQSTCFEGQCVTSTVRCDENDPRCEIDGTGGAGGTGGTGGTGTNVSASLSALSSSLASSSISSVSVGSSSITSSTIASSSSTMNSSGSGSTDCNGMCVLCAPTRSCQYYVSSCICACDAAQCAAACPSFPSAVCGTPNPCNCQSGLACTVAQANECTASGGMLMTSNPCVCVF